MSKEKSEEQRRFERVMARTNAPVTPLKVAREIMAGECGRSDTEISAILEVPFRASEAAIFERIADILYKEILRYEEENGK